MVMDRIDHVTRLIKNHQKKTACILINVTIEVSTRSAKALIHMPIGNVMVLILLHFYLNNDIFTGRGSSVGSMSASQAAVPRSILTSSTFFRGKIISLFR